MNNTIWKILVAVLTLVIVVGAIIAVVYFNQPGCEHTFEETVLTPATCVGEGVMQRKCTNPECGWTENETIPALGHDDKYVAKKNATCTEEGHVAYVACTRCNRSTLTADGIIPPKGHNGVWVVDTVGNCMVEGKKEYVCTSCNAVLDEQTTGLGDHELALLIPKEATCYETGLTAGWYCSICEEVLVEQEVIPMEDHTLTYVPAVAATCKDGHYAYYYCSAWGCPYTEWTDELVIPAIYDHVYAIAETQVGYSAPTCYFSGSRTFAVLCTTCGDEKPGTRRVETIDALGHDLVNHGAKAATCTEYGWDAYEVCSRCAYSTFSEIAANGHTEEKLEAVPATCTTPGLEEGSKCSVCGEITVEQKVIPAFGHTEEAFRENKIQPTCLTVGSYDKVVKCSTCEVELDRQTVEIPALGHAYVDHAGKAANCVETGWDAYQTCTRCDYTSYNATDALGHDKVNHDAKAATCTDIGWNAYETCTRCSYSTYVEIPALGHTTVVDAAKAPNCVDTGLTEGSHCSTCSTVFVAQQTIPATGHNIDETIGKCTNAGCSEGFSLGLAYIFNADGTLTVAGLGDCKDSNVVIPSQLDGAPVVAIASRAFDNNEKITSVVIPDSVKIIESFAFNRCKNLTSVYIGNGVETIGNNAFYTCHALTTVTIGSNVKVVGNDAFYSSNISVVYYKGTATQWNNISFGSRNDDLTGATRKYI